MNKENQMTTMTKSNNSNSTNLISKDRLLVTFTDILATAESDEQAISDMYEALLFEKEVSYDMLAEINEKKSISSLIFNAANGNVDTESYHLPLNTIEDIERTYRLFKEKLRFIDATIVRENDGIAIIRHN